jgi:hypothetical protein
MRERIQNILNNVDAVSAALSALPGDSWIDVDQNNNGAVEQGSKGK